MVTFEQFRTWALSYPEVTEEPHFEKPSFRVKKKIFSSYDAVNKRACVKLSVSDQDLFSLSDKINIYPVPNKWGQQGWTFVDLQHVKTDVFKEILKIAYSTVAPPKLSEEIRKR